MRITIWTTLIDNDDDDDVVKAHATEYAAQEHILTWAGLSRAVWEAEGGTNDDLHDMYKLKHGWSYATFSIESHELDLPLGQLELPLR